jgi:hypothetical protein
MTPNTHYLQKLSAFGLSGGYVDWFGSYQTNSQFQDRVSEILSSPFEVLTNVPHWFVLEPQYV